MVLLGGAVEIETSLHKKRVLKAGEVLLAEDVTGKGNRSRNIENKERRPLFILIK